MFERVPHELRSFPQWVCWRYLWRTGEAKPTKVPYDPKTGNEASVTEPNTWATFDEAVAASPQYSGIGFVLSVNDPFAFIDLDDAGGDPQLIERQKLIHDTFNSYSELSPSGNGCHVILKGHVQSGRRRACVEVYSQLRYMTVTGNVINDAPIAERQAYLEILWNEIGKDYITHNIEGTLVATETDQVIFERAMQAANGDKFRRLWEGDWQTLYASQSEADFALIDIIAFYTQNRNQIRSLFNASALGKRDKARRVDYTERMINRSFDRQIPKIDFEGLKNNIAQQLAEVEARHSMNSHSVLDYEPELPPGLVGEIARFIYAASPRPVKDIALMGAIGVMSGIVGRAYNISGTGLNLYSLLLAKTGRGKEAMAIGIDKLFNSVRLNIPSITNFVGPGDIASGQALVRYLAETSPSFVSIIGEFDKILMALSHQRANSAMIMLRKAILDLFNKSGFGQSFKPMIYSDSKKSIPPIQSPSFSILGECTPEKFYELLSENFISEGLLPRFFVVEYQGDRPKLNKDHEKAEPSQELKSSLVRVVGASLTLQRGPDGAFRVVNIMQDQDAADLIDVFDKFCDDQINQSNRDAIAQLWNRAHLKVLKIAGIVAVGIDPYEPKITREVAAWAMRFVERDVRNLLSRFDAGEIGSDEGKQLSDIRRVFSEYVGFDYSRVAKYGVLRGLHAAKIIPQSYLQRRLSPTASFRNDRLGQNAALKRSLGILLDQAEIVEVNKDQLQREFNTSGKAYMIKEMLL